MNTKRIRIVVIVDLSEGTENLIDFGLHLSKMMKAKILFVHQVIGMFPAMTEKDYRDKIYKTEIEDVKSKLSVLVNGRVYVNEHFVVSEKPLLTMLSEIKSEYYTDWVVGGMKESTLLKRILIGSTFTKIVDNSDLLIVAVPVSRPVNIPKKILIAVTHEYALNIAYLTHVLSAFQDAIMDVQFFSIVNEEKDGELEHRNLLHLQNKFSIYHPKISLLKGDDKFKELKKYLENTENTFLILQEGNRSFLDDLLRKYMINEIIHSVSIPLIILPNE